MYDFMIFGYFSAAIGRAFFAAGSEFASLMFSMTTFAVVDPAAGGYFPRRLHRSRGQTQGIAGYFRAHVHWYSDHRPGTGL